MVVYNVTVEDTSPMISYEGTWVWSDDDIYYTNYSQASSHGTNQVGASATFKFKGSAVYLYGAKRENHGNFEVTLDGHSEAHHGYQPPGSISFKTLLFGETSLDEDDEHTLVLKNKGSSRENMSWVDIDYIVFTVSDKEGGHTTPKPTRIDDADSRFSWSSNWGTDEDSGFGWKNTQHRTYLPGASVTVTFEGNAIGIHCTTTTASGPFSISIDDDDEIELNAYSPKFVNDTLLYFASGLDPGQHTLILTHTGSNDSTFIGLDYLEVFDYKTSPMSAAEKGAIVAGVLLAIFLLLLIPLSVCLWRRYRGRQKRHALRTAQPYMQLIPTQGSVDDATYRSAASSRHAIFGSTGSPHDSPTSAMRTDSPTSHNRFGSGVSRDNLDLNSLVRSPVDAYNVSRDLHLNTVLSIDRAHVLAHGREDSSIPLLAAEDSPRGGSSRILPAGVTIIYESERPPVYTSPRPSLHTTQGLGRDRKHGQRSL